MRPGGSPSGSAWKSVDLCGFRLGTKNAKPVQSVGIQKQLGPEDVFGLACFDPNFSRPAIWLSARAYTFCYMCLACYHTTTNLIFFFTVSVTRLNFFFTVSLPKLNLFFYRVNPKYLRYCCKYAYIMRAPSSIRDAKPVKYVIIRMQLLSHFYPIRSALRAR